MPELFEQIHKSLLPKGKAWSVKQGGDFDKLLSGSADNHQIVKDFLSQLANIRNPEATLVLDDLEREFGILKNPGISEEDRRMTLKSKMFARGGAGTIDDMQNALDTAGFILQVHSNSPAVDPALFLDQNFQVILNGPNAFIGREDAFLNRSGGELLVNGDIFSLSPAYESQANGATSFLGNSSANLGFFINTTQTLLTPPIPTDPDSWPFIFFVGGDATRDPITDELTEIEIAEVDTIRRTELFKIILKIKPIYTWAGLVITFI